MKEITAVLIQLKPTPSEGETSRLTEQGKGQTDYGARPMKLMDNHDFVPIYNKGKCMKIIYSRCLLSVRPADRSVLANSPEKCPIRASIVKERCAVQTSDAPSSSGLESKGRCGSGVRPVSRTWVLVPS